MIHEWLSNAQWLSPQIDYLVWLQNIRIHSSPLFSTFFLGITKFGELAIPTLVMSIIYWCIDTEIGFYLFSLNAFGLWVSKLFKMIACVYRPWVLSERVQPLKAAIKMAKGYSFPSGHTLMATTTWGGLAFVFRKKKFICAAFILLVLLIAFSRNYVGVHTPQDVIFSLGTGLILIFGIYYLIKWCDKNKNRYLYLIPTTDILGLLSMFYFIHKPYPKEFLNGELLVDPTGAIYLSVIYIGWILGLLNGLFLLKKFPVFDAKKGSLKFKIISGLAGLIILLIINITFESYLFAGVNRAFALAFCLMYLGGFFITAGYPFILSKIQNKFSPKY